MEDDFREPPYKRPKTEQPSIAAHYNSIQRNLSERSESCILQLRSFNNFIKAILLNLYCPHDATVLDLCCGKGGDLKKFLSLNIRHYVGADHAQVSIDNAVERYNMLRKPPFSAQFIVADCHKHNLFSSSKLNHMWFDFVSCQFALHYAFESRDSAETFIQNACRRLKPGGAFVITMPNSDQIMRRVRELGVEFGNDIYGIRFLGSEKCCLSDYFVEPMNPFGIKYYFKLKDAIEDCPEFIVPLITLQKLLLEHGVILEKCISFHEFAIEQLKNPEFQQLMKRMKVFGSTEEKFDQNQWEAIGIYQILIFRKLTFEKLKQLNFIDKSNVYTDYTEIPTKYHQPSIQIQKIKNSDIIVFN